MSLRDAERVMDVMIWFSHQEVLFDLMDEHGDRLNDDADEEMNLMNMEESEVAYEVLRNNFPWLLMDCITISQCFFTLTLLIWGGRPV